MNLGTTRCKRSMLDMCLLISYACLVLTVIDTGVLAQLDNELTITSGGANGGFGLSANRSRDGRHAGDCKENYGCTDQHFCLLFNY